MTFNSNNFIITGGNGYIGSHLALELLKSGHSVISIDNLSNSKIDKVNIFKKKFPKYTFIQADINNPEYILERLPNIKYDTLFHMAALKSVTNSYLEERNYHYVNISGTKELKKIFLEKKIKNIVFSSTCAVYGESVVLPIDENQLLNPLNPYAYTKKEAENILTNYFNDGFFNSLIILRFFNPIGYYDIDLFNARSSEDKNVFEFMIDAVLNERVFKIYGNDYNTKDGTAERDYVSIKSIITAHMQCINIFKDNVRRNIVANLGSGSPISVLDLVKLWNSNTKNNLNIKYEYAPRRIGDISSIYADNKLAKKILSWNVRHSLSDAVKDTLRCL